MLNGKIVVIYGSTEAGFITGAFKQQRFGSCGLIAPNVQIKIIDDEEQHKPKLGPTQTGEICVKTKALFSGYFGEPEKTVETFVDGWIQTGDVGYFDDD